MSTDSRNDSRISPFVDKDKSELFLKRKFVPHSKQIRRGIKTNQSILYAEIIAVFGVIHTKHTNAFFGNNVKILLWKLALHKVKSKLW